MVTDRNALDRRFKYDVYGNEYQGKLQTSPAWSGVLRSLIPYGFTGKRFEPELGLFSFAFRDYNPRIMRWLTGDPVKDGSNWYQYCGGAPVNFADPSGLELVIAGGEKKYMFGLITTPADTQTIAKVGLQLMELDPTIRVNLETGEVTQDTTPETINIPGVGVVTSTPSYKGHEEGHELLKAIIEDNNKVTVQLLI